METGAAGGGGGGCRGGRCRRRSCRRLGGIVLRRRLDSSSIRPHAAAPLKVLLGRGRGTLRLLPSRRTSRLLSTLSPRSRFLTTSTMRPAPLSEAVGSRARSATISRATFLRWQRSKRSSSLPCHLTRGTALGRRVARRAALAFTPEIRTGTATTASARQVRQRTLPRPIAKITRRVAATITTTS